MKAKGKKSMEIREERINNPEQSKGVKFHVC